LIFLSEQTPAGNPSDLAPVAILSSTDLLTLSRRRGSIFLSGRVLIAVCWIRGAVTNSSDDSEQVSTTAFLSSSFNLARSTVPLGGITMSSSAKLTPGFSAATGICGVLGQYEAVAGPVARSDDNYITEKKRTDRRHRNKMREKESSDVDI